MFEAYLLCRMVLYSAFIKITKYSQIKINLKSEQVIKVFQLYIYIYILVMCNLKRPKFNE